MYSKTNTEKGHLKGFQKIVNKLAGGVAFQRFVSHVGIYGDEIRHTMCLPMKNPS